MAKNNNYSQYDFKTTELKTEAINDIIRKSAPLDGKIKLILFLCGIFVLPYLIAVFFILNQRKWGSKKVEQAWKSLHMGLGLAILLLILAYLFH